MIKCEHLVKKYMSTTAVSDLSLDIISGNIYALLGPNGSGKSTLMKMIAGLSKPSSGTITMDQEQSRISHICLQKPISSVI